MRDILNFVSTNPLGAAIVGFFAFMFVGSILRDIGSSASGFGWLLRVVFWLIKWGTCPFWGPVWILFWLLGHLATLIFNRPPKPTKGAMGTSRNSTYDELKKRGMAR